MDFYHPEGFTHEHGGFLVNGAVSEDIAGIRAADGVVAYISETPQTGTITEVLHAVHTDTPTLVLFKYQESGEGVVSGMVNREKEDYEKQSLRYPVEVSPVSMRGNSNDYWFLINYLVGDSELDDAQSNMKDSVDGALPGVIKQWSGISQATVMAVRDSEEDIHMAVRSWIESEFGLDAASTVI